MTSKNKITRIRLNATWNSDIVWSAEQKRADEIVSENRRIFWEFDFGCTDPRGFRLQDSLRWNTHRFAVEHFTASIWPKYEKATAGISLFQGPLDWIHYLYWDETQKEHFQRWKQISPIPGVSSCSLDTRSLSEQNRHILSLYGMAQLSNYLHCLSAYLPEEVMRVASFDTSKSTSVWRAAQLLSRERFPHILIDTTHPGIFSLESHFVRRDSIAVCLPQDQYLTEEIGEIWESMCIELQKKSISFRVIPEIFIAEEWADLEEIIVLTSSLSEFGLRQLQGFSTSEGKIIFYGGALGIPNAIAWDEWIR